MFSLWIFFTVARCCGRYANDNQEKLEVVSFTALLVVVSVQMILLHLKLAIEYIMSWFAVLSPTYIVLALIMCVFCMMRFEFSEGASAFSKFVQWVCRLPSLTTASLLIFSVLVAVVGDGHMHIAIAFIPLYLIELMWVHFYFLDKETNVKRKFSFIALLLSLMVCEVLLSLSQFLHSYAWFAWLLPVTITSVIIWMRDAWR
jgi:hypothetical protein